MSVFTVSCCLSCWGTGIARASGNEGEGHKEGHVTNYNNEQIKKKLNQTKNVVKELNSLVQNSKITVSFSTICSSLLLNS